MLDLYSDFTMIQAQTGAHVELLEMCDLDRMMGEVTEAEIEKKKKKAFASSGTGHAPQCASHSPVDVCK